MIDESDVFFRNLMESAPDAMIIVTASGHIELVNVQAERMFGYQRDELLGRPVEMLLPMRLREQHESHRDDYAAAPAVRPMGQGLDLVALKKDGTEIPVEISLSPVETAHGRFISSVVRDVTLRRKMETDIKAAQQAAERANKANSAFLAAASHDLRQPVQALSLLNGALRRTVKDERALQMVHNQEASLLAMTNLLNSLLDISRLDAGAIAPEWEEFPMQRLIDRLSAEFARQATQKGLEFSAGQCCSIVRSDPNLLAEIATNLVSNAIRYTESGTVHMQCIERDGKCLLQISDTGIGIDADQFDDIFREFHQCQAKPGRSEGFGLGLAIVRRLTDLLEHQIDVESEPGRGSVFTVTIPLASASVAAAAASDRISDAAAPASGLVFLIEDNAIVADAWCLLLEAEGYSVAIASSADEARSLVSQMQGQPVLLIADFHLQNDSTGVEAVQSIRDHFAANIPAFIVSGDTSKVVRDARLLDNCALISKPVDSARLLSAAQRAVLSGEVQWD